VRQVIARTLAKASAGTTTHAISTNGRVRSLDGLVRSTDRKMAICATRHVATASQKIVLLSVIVVKKSRLWCALRLEVALSSRTAEGRVGIFFP